MLFKNTLAQTTSMVVGYVCSFLLAPVMLSRLGLSNFGVWAVTGALATYAGLLDLGVGRSLARFVAFYDASGDERAMRECVGLGLVAVTVVGLASAAVAAALAPTLADELHAGLSTGDMRIVLLSSVAIYTFNGYSSSLNAYAIGIRRMVPPNITASLASLVNFGFSIAALATSTSLVHYAVANAAASFVSIFMAVVVLTRLARAPYLALPSLRRAKEILSFGLKNQLVWIADLVNFETDKVVIALLVDVRAAGAYEIGARVVGAVRSLGVMSVSAMIPTATAAIVERGRSVVGEMYRRYTRLSTGVAFPLFILAAAGSPFLLVAWLGDVPGNGDEIVTFLTLAYFVNMSTAVPMTLAMGAGEPGVVALNSVITAALNLVFTLALAPLLGLWGVIGGTFAAISGGSLLFVARFQRRFGLGWRDYRAAVAGPAALSLALGVPLALFSLVAGAPDGRPQAIAVTAAMTAYYALAYWILATRIDCLPGKLRFPWLRPRRAGVAAQSARS
ncbi:MAG: oligosaccharide flippase family protein [Thermoleophilaceae bacterium]|nr:oligosaccharide flippase family protein [Thermoleophilaceae bacterium]